jgi:hypothetical protein
VKTFPLRRASTQSDAVLLSKAYTKRVWSKKIQSWIKAMQRRAKEDAWNV